MATSPPPSLATLPLLVLEKICEYLDDYTEDRRRKSLQAFSLTCRACCAAATPQLFCQITLEITSSLPRSHSGIGLSLKRCAAVLGPAKLYRHVRRLKIARDSKVEGSPPDDDWADGDSQPFDMHDFCQPRSTFVGRHWPANTPSYSERAWRPLARFITKLPALQDLVWACGSDLPRCILNAVHDRKCRLHMHYFHPRSLIRLREGPNVTDPDDYALASSPSLCSIVAIHPKVLKRGRLNYITDAIQRMVAGAAPNLAHVKFYVRRDHEPFLDCRESLRLRSAWAGFFPDATVTPPGVGSLQSLCHTFTTWSEVVKWSNVTDFTKLRCLTTAWNMDNGADLVEGLAEMALHGNFASLKNLSISHIWRMTVPEQQIFIRFIQHLPRLQSLHLDGHISPSMFQAAVHRHGSTLRHLSVEREECLNIPTPVACFSAPTIQLLVRSCPSLSQLHLAGVPRTHGDAQEVLIYRALGTLPRLRRLSLRLHYAVGPDNDFWNTSTYRPQTPTDGPRLNDRDIPAENLRDCFANSAIDETLARSIFDTISPAESGSLTTLYLRAGTKGGVRTPAVCGLSFTDMLKWLSRSWYIQRGTQGGVTVMDIDRTGTAVGEQAWRILAGRKPGDYLYHNGDEVYTRAFQEVWPPKGEKWWEEWESLPLSEG